MTYMEQKSIEDYKQEIRHYRQVLKSYANMNWYSWILDQGKLAKDALEGK